MAWGYVLTAGKAAWYQMTGICADSASACIGICAETNARGVWSATLVCWQGEVLSLACSSSDGHYITVAMGLQDGFVSHRELIPVCWAIACT
jgi:hypothetical protein